MSTALIIQALDLVLIGLLAGAVYWPRHRRRDLVVAFVGINVGVLSVASLLSGSAVSAGLGLGLFGVLSIIRLRSDELAQHEIAYYFAALAIGLIGGLGTDLVTSAILMGLIVATLFVTDHPLVLRGWQRQVLVLDHAHADQTSLVAALEQRLGGRVLSAQTLRLDLVNDTTTVDVRFRTVAAAARPEVVTAR